MAEESFSELTFEELELSSSIRRAIREMGFETATPIQAQAIPVLLEGRDVIGQAQTGTGKTAAFGLPILQKIDPDNKNLQAVILCPTRELAVQAANELRGFAKYMHDVKVLPVYGGQDIVRQIRGLKGVQIIVGTPGRVMDHMRRHTIKMDHVSMVVLDEADEMLNMGFREDMEVILGAIDHPHQTCLFSATMPQAILDLTDQYQTEPQLIKITREELTMDNIHQYYYAVKREYKTLALVRLLAFYRYHRCVIFCNTKAMVDELATHLQEEGYTAEGLHGDLTQKQRDYVMGRFRAGSLTCLIATDIAARGIDVDNVEAVFNYDLPQETEYYVHRIGRTGRAGKEGASHTLCRSRDFQRIHEIENICHAAMEERRIPTPAQIREGKERQTLDKAMAVLSEGHSGNLIPVIREYCQANEITPEAFAAAFLRMEMGDDMDDTEDIEIDLPDNRGRRRDGDRRRRNPFDRRDRRGDDRRDDRSDRRDDNRRDDRRNRREDDRRGDRRSRREDDHRERRSDRRERRSDFYSKNPDRSLGDSIFERIERDEQLVREPQDGNEHRGRHYRAEREERRDRKEHGHDRKERGRSRDKRETFEKNGNVSRQERREMKTRNKERSRRILDKSMKDLRRNGEPFKKHHK